MKIFEKWRGTKFIVVWQSPPSQKQGPFWSIIWANSIQFGPEWHSIVSVSVVSWLPTFSKPDANGLFTYFILWLKSIMNEHAIWSHGKIVFLRLVFCSPTAMIGDRFVCLFATFATHRSPYSDINLSLKTHSDSPEYWIAQRNVMTYETTTNSISPTTACWMAKSEINVCTISSLRV